MFNLSSIYDNDAVCAEFTVIKPVSDKNK